MDLGEKLARDALLTLLKQIPASIIEVDEQQVEPAAQKTDTWCPDFVVSTRVNRRRWHIACEYKSQGEPRFVRAAASQLRMYAVPHGTASTYPVVMAPYISDESARICQQLEVGYADLAGNCRIAFDSVYLERRTGANPFKKPRAQRALFAPKSARVLRCLLRDPNRTWKIVELANAAKVSLGQISKLTARLLEHEWAERSANGVFVAKPLALLHAWRDAYRLSAKRSDPFYTLLHGAELQQAIQETFSKMGGGDHLLLASYSAAQWHAPYARGSGTFLYADELGRAMLKLNLKLEPPGIGANVSVMQPTDDGMFLDQYELPRGIWCTSPVQTYLDLWVSGERGKEAAEHLFREAISPKWGTIGG